MRLCWVVLTMYYEVDHADLDCSRFPRPCLLVRIRLSLALVITVIILMCVSFVFNGLPKVRLLRFVVVNLTDRNL